VLRHITDVTHPDLLVGAGAADDAAVFRLPAGRDQALVVSADFFTPIVDDPYAYGQIAAANALSDVWAMGGEPFLALNLVGFPVGCIPLDTLEQILLGGRAKAEEAGVIIAGGHSVEDPEPKYGLAVVGLVHPDHILTNAGARPGDVLIFTKPLGTGIIATAIKGGEAPDEAIAAATASMAALNRPAYQAVAEVGAHAVTDVTGFGLMGHLFEMTRASKVGARVRWSDAPLLAGALDLAQDGFVPAGTQRNRDFVEPVARWSPDLPELAPDLLCDPQTSGGFVIAVAPGSADSLCQALTRRGALAAPIGEISDDPQGAIHVVP
jgi:selenide,water dikinase